MDLPEHVGVRPDVMMGKRRLKGTRIPAHLILEKLAAGETAQDILAAYPQLRPSVKLLLDEDLSSQHAGVVQIGETFVQ